MIRSFFGRCALILATLVALAPAAPVFAMDAPEGTSVSGSNWLGKTTIVLVAPLAAWGLLYRKHHTALHAIERRIDMSTISATSKDHNFLCATWRSTEDNTPNLKPWIFPNDLWQGGKEAARTFADDAINHADRVYLYDALGVRHEPSTIQAGDLSLAIAIEKLWFEEQMAFVAQFTDVPQMIVAQYAQDDTRCLSAQELTFGCAVRLKIIPKADVENFINTIDTKVHAASKLKSIMHCGGWLPTSWSLAPCYQEASRVYLKLFLTYSRLCALDAAWLAEHSAQIK